MTSFLNQVMQGDCIELIKEIPSDYVHLILSDIPYGIGMDDWDVLHDNTNNAYMGTSPAQLKAGAVFKKEENLLMDGQKLIGLFQGSIMNGV